MLARVRAHSKALMRARSHVDAVLNIQILIKFLYQSVFNWGMFIKERKRTIVYFSLQELFVFGVYIVVQHFQQRSLHHHLKYEQQQQQQKEVSQ